MTPEVDSPSEPGLGGRLRLVAGALHWPVVVGLAVASLALGYVGFALYFASRGEAATVSDILYLTLQLFVMESGGLEGPVPWPLDVARWLAPAVAGFTAFKALAVVFRDQLEALRVGRLRDHVVICGQCDSGPARQPVRQDIPGMAVGSGGSDYVRKRYAARIIRSVVDQSTHLSVIETP